MSRVDTLANSTSSSSVIFLKFTRIAAKGLVAIFFEGEDEKYYSVRINSHLSQEKWTGIICGGKEKVIKARKDIREHSEYKDVKCLFFVDADFDDNTELQGYSDTYITPCYSIENLYISDTSFKQILSAEFQVKEHDDEKENFDKAMSCYQNFKSSYLNNISHFNYFIRSYRLMEKQGIVQGRLNINNVNFDKLIKINLTSGVKQEYNENNIIDLFKDADKNIAIDIIDSANHFQNCNKELWFRGKQHLEFFRQFINLLIDDRHKRTGRIIFTDKGNVKLTKISEDNAISALSQYADTPSCLIDFLQNFSLSLQK